MGVRTLGIALLLVPFPFKTAIADCPASPGGTNDLLVSFLQVNTTQAAPASLFASTVKEGMLVYDDAANALKLCDGANWISVGGAAESDPQVATLTASKWCVANAGGTAIDCTADAPQSAAAGAVTGAVQFRGASAVFAADDGNFVWDDTNNRLGIGTASPSNVLTLVKNQNAYTEIELVNSNPGGETGIRFRESGGGSKAVIAALNSGWSSLPANGLIIWNYSNAPILFSTNNTERMRIDGAGSVGIGATSPNASALLDLSSTTRGFLPPRMTTAQVNAIATPPDGLLVYDTDTDTIKLRANGAWVSLGTGGGGPPAGTVAGAVQFRGSSVVFAADDANLVWDDTNNRLGIGTTSPDQTLSVSGGITIDHGHANTGTTANALAFGSTSGEAIGSKRTLGENQYGLDFYTSGVNRLAITLAGNVGIGTTAPTHILHIVGQGRATSSSWATSSDARVKTKVQTIENGLEVVERLRPVSFEYSAEYQAGNLALTGSRKGFIAQEVEVLQPSMVQREKEKVGDRIIDDFRVLNSSDLVPLLVSALKQLKADNDSQSTQIDDLRREIDAMKSAN